MDPQRQNLFHVAPCNTLVGYNPVNFESRPLPECVCELTQTFPKQPGYREWTPFFPGVNEQKRVYVCVCVVCGLHPGDEQ